MNIIQIEDNLKSIPDQRLQDEMVTPSGMFPQYLVMSEINRRSKMREDYQGRMAANEKTPPRPSIREEMIMSMQPVSRGGIEDMTPLNSIAQESSISPISQQPVRMSEGRTVDPFSLYGFEYREDDPETEEIRIEVVDDGVGLPEGFDWSTRDSLGLYLVQALSEQLDAELKAESDGGTRFLISFRRRKNMFDGD